LVDVAPGGSVGTAFDGEEIMDTSIGRAIRVLDEAGFSRRSVRREKRRLLIPGIHELEQGIGRRAGTAEGGLAMA
jgi:hypothetical protein